MRTNPTSAGYRFGHRLGTMLVLAVFVIAIGVLLVLAMGALKLVFFGAGFIVSHVLNLPIDNPVVAIVASVGVLWALFEASRGFDK